LNLGIGALKVKAAGAAIDGALGLAPETAGGSLLGLIPAAYMGVSGAGQTGVGAGQLCYAFTGNQASSAFTCFLMPCRMPFIGSQALICFLLGGVCANDIDP
jgi:hypothetical protein